MVFNMHFRGRACAIDKFAISSSPIIHLVCSPPLPPKRWRCANGDFKAWKTNCRGEKWTYWTVLLQQRIKMMKALNNSSPKDFDGDKNSLEMKCLNSNCESSVNLSCESTSLENSVDKLGLETDSLVNSHESLSSSLPSVCASEASNSSQDSGKGRIVPTDLQLILKRQGLTVEDLMQSAPPFAVSWKSARNVFQCLTCATPIDFLSRKVR